MSLKKTMIEQIPCKLIRPGKDGHFLSMRHSYASGLRMEAASTITARYCHGPGSNNDNMVLEMYLVEDETDEDILKENRLFGGKPRLSYYDGLDEEG